MIKNNSNILNLCVYFCYKEPVSEPMARNHKTPSTKFQKQDNIQEYEQMLEQLYRSELIDLVVKYENYRSKLNEKLNSN